MIRFNKPYMFGQELEYVNEAVIDGRLAGNGRFTKACHEFFQTRYGFKKVLMTTSCTDALEMSAILLRIQPGDEVIIPSYTFVSTANAFALRGAKIVFADSSKDHPNVSIDSIKECISDRTKAIVVVHYGGVACEMDQLLELCNEHEISLVEDAAQAIEASYKGRPLGSFGDCATFSFHETKNVVSGEGGLLVINNEELLKRAEIIWEKGTNRTAFFRGEVDKYSWVDLGSSFLPSELISAYLYGQLENVETIQTGRVRIWETYYSALQDLAISGMFTLPKIPSYATNNAHVFYIVCRNVEERNELLSHLKDKGIGAVFHYLSLHKSEFFKEKHDERELINADRFSDCLVRLPLHLHLTDADVAYIVDCIKDFYTKQ
jgi:dTDP-4-amino-4,6-dideoxygalactose transaminase